MSGYTHVEDAHGASSYLLDSNGLKVILIPKRELPVVGVQITYHVGSRHELPGHTGATHILEHIMFKGAEKHDPKKGNGIWQLLEKKGAALNATTWCDRTNYYSVGPTTLLGSALSIEADRMRNLLLRPEDVVSEMTVVRNEYESGENDPYQRLSKQAWYEAFTLHPYRYPTIGTKEDIENVSVQKLKKFYNTFYWPNNATLSIIGDIEREAMLENIAAYFGAISRQEITEPAYNKEPLQETERRFRLKRKGSVNALLFCFKAPAGLHKDSAPLSILATILGEGKSSLLYQELVDTGVALDVHVEFPRFKDPSLFEIYIPLSGKEPHEKTEERVWKVIASLKEKVVDAPTLTRARNYSVAEYAYGKASVSGMLSMINESISRGDWKDMFTFDAALKTVTGNEVQGVAERYLTRDSLTIGYLDAV